MTKHYFKLAALAVAMVTAQGAMAYDEPFAKFAQAPADGQTYTLVSKLDLTRFTRPTSWDGALYLQPYDLDQVTNASLTAIGHEDGSWSFSHTDANGATLYMGIHSSGDNLRIQEAEPAIWYVEQSDAEGYYLLKAGAGQGNPMTEGGYLHLNKGGEYLVITETSNYWFPDFYGGPQTNDQGDYLFDQSGFVVPLDPISRYWGFVELSDVPLYVLNVDIYTLLQNIEQNYLQQTDYAAGFQSLYDYCLQCYEKADATAEELTMVKAAADAKMELYNEILKAQELLANGNPSSVFSEAIAAATAVFNVSNDPEALKAATSALKEAETTYALGGDDLTSLVQNNSFEDLSSQGGSMTSGVAGAPTGWNVFINGKQVTTAAEVQAAGISAWHGINDDADGAKDGEYAFGLWTSGVPEYEVSQTLSGLEDGSYTIMAAVMVGANGNGSRRTTQRIFGNHNSKYFGADYDYNPERLDKTEVYGFEGLEELYTDRTLQEMTVRAFVYDGTLTFGLRTNGDYAAANREGSNSAGGDGWFKLDNFRIYKEGYIQDDALAVYNNFAALLDDLSGERMQESVKQQLDAVIGGNIGAASSKEEIINGIVALKNLYPTVKASVQLYAELWEAIVRGYAALIEYDHSASAGDFADLLEEASDGYDFGELGEEEIRELIAKINDGIELLKATEIVVGDVTYVLKNPSFEDLSAQGGQPSDGAVNVPAGWTLKVNGEEATTVGGGWCAINRGDGIDVSDEEGNYYDHQYTDGEFLWGVWNGSMPEVELSQTLTHMPEGAYTLTADVMVQAQWAGNCLTTQRLFANRSVQMYGTEADHELNLPEDARNALLLTYANYDCEKVDGLADHQQPSALLRPMTVHFDVTEDGIATIGFRTNNVERETGELGGNCHGWFKLDNFRLVYDSTERLAVEGITLNSDAATTSFYTIDGRRLQAPQRGLNIMRTAGRTVKIMVK